MKPLTYSERMAINDVLIRKEKRREAFEEYVKMAKKILGEDKIVVIK